MKAVCISGYGGRERLELRETESPTPCPSEVLIRVYASSVNPIDWKLRRGHLRFVWPLAFPFTPGFDAAGVIHVVGQQVTKWKVGDAVYAALTTGGGHAEYAVCDQSNCAPIPAALTYEEAAVIPGAALSALQSLRDIGRVQARNHVVINGASGGVGTFAVQIAVALDCQVTAITSTRNVDLVQSLGANVVVDYTRERIEHSEPCDVFFDVVPNRSFRGCSRILKANGIYVTTVPGLNPLMWKVLTTAARPFGYKKRCGWLILRPNSSDLIFINRLIAEKKLRPIVGCTYSIDEIHEATEHSESGHARGKIALRIP